MDIFKGFGYFFVSILRAENTVIFDLYSDDVQLICRESCFPCFSPAAEICSGSEISCKCCGMVKSIKKILIM